MAQTCGAGRFVVNVRKAGHKKEEDDHDLFRAGCNFIRTYEHLGLTVGSALFCPLVIHLFKSQFDIFDSVILVFWNVSYPRTIVNMCEPISGRNRLEETPNCTYVER